MSYTFVNDTSGKLVVKAICDNAHDINQLIEALLKKRDRDFVEPQLKEQAE